jgi:hypothetical protein
MSIIGKGGGGVGGGSNTPGAPNTSVQFNNGGSFAGDANLTWVGASGLSNLKHAAFGADALMNTSTLDGITAPIVLAIEEIQSLGAGGSCYGEFISITGSPTVNDATIAIRGLRIESFVPSSSNKNFGAVQGIVIGSGSEASSPAKANSIYGLLSTGYIGGTGAVGQMAGASFVADNYGSGTADIATGIYCQLQTSTVSSTITDGYGVWVDSPSNTGTITRAHGILIADQTAGGTNYSIKTGLGIFAVGDFMQISKVTAPGVSPANTGRLFIRDNGSGKMQLAAIFPSGAVQAIVTEP